LLKLHEEDDAASLFLIPFDGELKYYWSTFFAFADYDPFQRLKDFFQQGIHFVLNESGELIEICILSFLKILQKISRYDIRFRTKNGLDIDYTYSASQNYFEALKMITVVSTDRSFTFGLRNHGFIISMNGNHNVTKMLDDVSNSMSGFAIVVKSLDINASGIHVQYTGDEHILHDQFLSFNLRGSRRFIAYNGFKNGKGLVYEEDKTVDIVLHPSFTIADISSGYDVLLYDDHYLVPGFNYRSHLLPDTMFLHEISFDDFDVEDSIYFLLKHRLAC
jgi:hypothetical protein